MREHCENKIILLCALGIIAIVICCMTTIIVDERWIGFSGALFGALLSGMITLYVMNKTIEDGKENVHQTIQENKKLKKAEEDMDFCKDLSDLISAYMQESSQTMKVLMNYRENYNKIEAIQAEISQLERKFEDSAKSIEMAETNMGIATHQERVKFYHYKLELYNQEIEGLRANMQLPDKTMMIKLYYNLKIRLESSYTANQLYDKMEKMLEYWEYDPFTIILNEDEFKKDMNDIFKCSKQIIDEIKKQSL